MKRPFLLVCVLVWALVLTGCDCGRKNRMPVVRQHSAADDETTIVIEAEDFVGELEPPVTTAEDTAASGGKCIHVEGGSGEPNEKHPVTGVPYPSRWGAALYNFNVKKAGTYRFWGRKFWQDGCGNSWTIVVSGGGPVIFGEDATYNSWDWLPASELFKLAEGENTLEVLNREDGVMLDKIILTTDFDFIPQGKE